ncbi:MAG: macro domain-containing protein [Acidobacteria bacterium]|nr:macro domain-containing protein [Acidobacteriota bacterium]
MHGRFNLQLGDIIAAKVEAIVCSAHENLTEGGPVHQAVHRAAGPGLMAECAALPECPAGEVRVTGAHRLPFKIILHAVPPTWMDGDRNELQELASCYRQSLEIARARAVNSIAFPSLGSGQLPQIPLDLAAPVALRTILEFLEHNEMPERVVLVCFDVPTYQAHQKALREILP